jgi:hypothetical protein
MWNYGQEFWWKPEKFHPSVHQSQGKKAAGEFEECDLNTLFHES